VIFAWLILSRAIHFAACLLIVATLGIERLIVAPVDELAAARWRGIARSLLFLAMPTALLSGMAWFAAVAADMSGALPTAPILELVWQQTHFGRLFQLRLILWVCVAVLALVRTGAATTWLALLLAAGLSVSLAWAGHGLLGHPLGWHLAIDGTHLLVAGFWPTGLLPYGLLIGRLLREPTTQNLRSISAVTYRFSAMSLACVALLAASGIVNSWFLVGSAPRLWQTNYGRVLSAKITLFVVMIGIGAINLLWLKPRSSDALAATHLRRNVAAEAMLGGGVIVLVAILGLLEPACH
jgi:copper resistance protein D